MSAADTPGPRYVLTLHGPRVVFGAGVARTELSSELDLLGANRVLLIASSREKASRAAELKPIQSRIAGCVQDVRRHVPIAAANAATALARDLDADCLLSIGGGSAVGTAKAVALTTGLPIVAVPTTYAGSEMTPIYGITENNVKRTARSDQVLPRTVLLDPTLSVDLPLDITRASAVNALAHCAGALFAANRSTMTDLMAVGGIKRLTAGLRHITSFPADLDARGDLSEGAYLAGTVLAHAGGSAHHTACHILGGAFDLPHAETHTALLPATVAFMQQRQPDQARVAAEALNDADAGAGIQALLAEVGATVRLRDIGLRQADLERASCLLSGQGAEPGVPGMDRAAATGLLQVAW